MDATRVEICIAAAAEAWRGDGEIVASGIGLVPRLAASLAKLTFNPDLLMTDSEALLVSEPVPVGRRDGYQPKVEGWLPFRNFFDIVWRGKRHVMTMPTQIDRWGNTNISCIGDWHRPKAQLLGVRGMPGNTVNHPTSYFVPNHGVRSLVEHVDMISGVGYEPERWPAGVKRDFHEIRLVVTNLGVFDLHGPHRTMRLRSVHPGVTVDTVRQQTAFALDVAGDARETRLPSAEELRLIREVLDPHNLRAGAIKD